MWGANGDTLFEQNFNSATAVDYAASTARTYTSSNYSSLCGTTATSQFTTITCNSKGNCGIGINSSTGGNSEDWTGKFGSYANNTSYYWSICKTSNFAATAPTAIKIEMNAAFSYVSSGSNTGVQIAVGSSFSSGLTNSCPALTNCVAGFSLPSNSSIKISKYVTSNGVTNLSSSTLTNGTSYKYTWIINNTASSLSYTDPKGNTSTVASGCWDLWVGNTLYCDDVTKATTGMSGTSLNNLYIGSSFGKKHEFVIDDIKVIDLTPAPACSAPAAPTITGTDSYTEGETITLTGTSSDAVSTTTYAWYEGADWATASAADPVQTAATAAAGGNVFSKTAALSDDGKKYWCEAANSTCKSHNETGFEISVAAAPSLTPTITGVVSPEGYGSISPASITVTSGDAVIINGAVLTCGVNTLTATPAEATAEYTYSFVEWTCETPVTTNVNATATFSRTANSYTLAWDKNAEDADALAGDYTSGSVAYGSDITKPNTPTRDGYDFLGWAESTDGEVVTVPETMPATNKTYYAKWAADPCAESAEVTNEIARFFVPCGLANYKNSSAWGVTDEEASTEDNTFSTYKFGGSSSNWDRNTTSGLIYGKLTANDAYISLKLKSGNFKAGDVVTAYLNSNSDNNNLKLHNQSSGNALGSASASGLNGEYQRSLTLVAADIEEDGTIKFFRVNSSTFVNRIIVTREPAPKHHVTYALNGATGTTPEQADVEEGESFTLHNGTTGITAPAGKAFAGWNDGTTDYAGGDSYTMGSSDVTLTAQWEDKYTVTLMPAGGSCASYDGWTYDNVNDKYTKEVGSGAVVTLPTFTKANRTFKTWRNTVPADVESPITVTADVTLTAVWNAKVENVIYSWEGAEGGATEVGGTAQSSTNGGSNFDNAQINVAQAGYYCIQLNGKNDYSTNIVEITLSGSEKVKAGDKIKYTGFYNNADTKNAAPKMRAADGTAIFSGSNLPNITTSEPRTDTHVVPSGINTATVQLTRAQTQSSSFLSKLQIIREVQVEEANIRTVTFNYNDGGATESTTVEVASGSKVSAPADPTYAHHRFNEWQLSGSAYDFDDPVTEDITLVANWTQLYTITFANGGGTGSAPAVADKAQNETFQVPANTFTAPEGKQFDKWNDGSADYAPGDTYTVGTANVTLTAQWVAICSGQYSFHYGPQTGAWETPICFEQVGETHEWNIADFTIPDHENGEFWVGYAGATIDGKSATKAWTDDYADNNGAMILLPTTGSKVGQAVGAKGTLVIWDNSSSKNLYVGFKPDGYGISYGESSYAFAATATANVWETNLVTLPDVSTTYTMGLATATEGTYVSCAHSAAAEAISNMSVSNVDGGKKKVYLYTENAGWLDTYPKMAVYDFTSGHDCWGDGTEDTKFMTKVNDNLWYGYVKSDATKLILVRVNPDYSEPAWDYGQSHDITLNAADSYDTYITITGWSDGKATFNKGFAHPATGQKGKFRIWDNSSAQNWYVNFVPYYTLSYDKNGGSGSMAATERSAESATTTVTVAANGFTAPAGKHFAGWAISQDHADAGTVDYAAGADYSLTADATLFAVWETTYAQSIDLATYAESHSGTAWQGYLNDNGYSYVLGSEEGAEISLDNSNAFDRGLKLKKSTTSNISFVVAAGKMIKIVTGKVNGLSIAINGGEATAIASGTDATHLATSYYYNAAVQNVVITETNTGYNIIRKINIEDPYQVSFNTHGGDPVAPQTFYGTALTLPSATNGTQIFKGWYDAETEGNKIGNAGESYTPTATVTLHAQWETVSSDNTLSDLQVDGATIAGFDPEVQIYNLVYEYGQQPVITSATATAGALATVTINNTPVEEATFKYVQVKVVAESGAEKFYQVRYTNKLKKGVSIIKATVSGGDQSAGFEATGYYGGTGYAKLASNKKMNTNNYVGVKLAAGKTFSTGDVLFVTTVSPSTSGGSQIEIYAESAGTNLIWNTEQIDLTDGIALPAAFDGLDEFYIVRKASEGAQAWNGLVDYVEVQHYMDPFIEEFKIGEAVGTIDQDLKTIAVEVPYSTDITSLTPTIKAWANGGATVSPSTAQDFSAGAVDYTVSSIYGETTTYAVTISKAEASHDATLSALSVAGYNIGFEASKLTYNVELPKGSVIGDLPAVSYTLNHVGATAVKTDATGLPGSTTIVVTAEDGLDANKKTYTINFTVGTMDKYVIFSGQTDALEAVPVSPSGLNWVKNSDNADKFKFVEYAYVAGYTNAIATGGGSNASRNIAVTIPADYEVVFEIAQASNSDATRRAYVGAANNTAYADALFAVESTSKTDGQKAKSDALAGGKTYYIHSDNSINILELNIYLDRVSETPAISAEPADMSVCEYGTDELSVTAAVSEGTLSYQWYKEVEGDDDEAVGTNSATYTPEAAGTYYVIITNTEGEYKPNSVTSEKATVTDQTVTIITDYANAKGDVNAEKTLSVTADGENLTYQWQACDAEGVVSVETILSTTASLDVTITADPQYYKVTVHGDCGDDQVQILKAEKWMNVEQANVTGTIAWDWKSTTAGWPTASNSHIDFENTSVEYLLANVSSQVPNNDNFRSDMLIGKGQYVWRNKSEGEYGFQGLMLKFHTEVAGLVRIYYRAPSSGQTSVVTIDGNSAGSRDNSWGWSEYVKVEADRDIEIVLTNGETGMTRVQKIEFYELGATSSEISGETDASTLTPGANVTVEDGATLTVDAAKVLNDLTVKEGGKVVLSNKELTVLGTFSIETTMASGESGQLSGATTTNFAAEDAYIDITLGDNANPEKWHAFTVPFPVDAINGIYDLDGNKLANEVNYAIMDYHGDIRATGAYGWKKYRSVMVPGTFYLMTVDGERTTYRMKKTANGALVAGNTKDLYEYASTTGNNDNGWNGVGNPTLAHGQVGYKVQVLNPTSYTYEPFDANETNFVVGTPFFIQAENDETMTFGAASGSANYAPARTSAKTIESVKVRFGNEEYMDKLYVTASEDALNTYEIGKDLVKMTMTNTPSVAQIFGSAYGHKLCMVSTPLVNDNAEVALTLYAPATGEYTISVPAVEGYQVYLVREGAIIWNLSDDAYTAEFVKGNNEGYAIRVVKAPQVATDIDNIYGNTSGVQKVVIDNNVFILRGEKMFDVTGKMVK